MCIVEAKLPNLDFVPAHLQRLVQLFLAGLLKDLALRDKGALLLLLFPLSAFLLDLFELRDWPAAIVQRCATALSACSQCILRQLERVALPELCEGLLDPVGGGLEVFIILCLKRIN